MDINRRDDLIETLSQRFARNLQRHPGVEWNSVLARLLAHPEKLKVLDAMEQSGGEPDVVAHDPASGQFIFCDCSPESPGGRRSLCYDRAALDARRENKPGGNVLDMAATMGVELLSEQQYRDLQQRGEFDRKTSSWIRTPDTIRALGGALFCDRRYGQVFVYHNGAESYYAARGFRGQISV